MRRVAVEGLDRLVTLLGLLVRVGVRVRAKVGVRVRVRVWVRVRVRVGVRGGVRRRSRPGEGSA